MQPFVILQVVILLSIANGIPVLAKRLFGSHLAYPIDWNLNFFDGRSLFGASKTIRGVLLSLLFTSAGARLLGVDAKIGLLFASASMAGDLFSSFFKRRLGLPPSSRATGLDQVPESLIPLLVCRDAFALTGSEIVASVMIFLIGEILLSRIFFKLHLRDRPY